MSGMDGMHACLSTYVPHVHNRALFNRADWHALLSQAQHKTSKDVCGFVYSFSCSQYWDAF